MERAPPGIRMQCTHVGAMVNPLDAFLQPTEDQNSLTPSKRLETPMQRYPWEAIDDSDALDGGRKS